MKGYFALFLLLDTGMMGVFVSLDFFPLLHFLGGDAAADVLPDRHLGRPAARVRGDQVLPLHARRHRADPARDARPLLLQRAAYLRHDPAWRRKCGRYPSSGASSQHLLWIALFIGFAIKIPAFPFHTWLPDAHVEAPTAISVILAGVLLKMGTYGILRINFGMLPVATAELAFWFLGALGTFNIVYGALCAMAQKDLKKLVAYSSISHMGYVMLGMAAFTPQGINGAVLQMFNHGTVTAMLFLLVGVIYDRAHHREIDGFGGLAAADARVYRRHRARVLRGDGTAGALGVHLGGAGAARRLAEVPGLTIVAASAVVLTAGYMLWTMQRICLGPLNEKYVGLPEINARELFTLVPLAVIVLILGVYPQAILDLMNTSLVHLNQVVLSASGRSAVAD